MSNLATRFCRDEAGFIVSTELVLVSTIVVIALVVGLATVRDAVVQELADVGLTIGTINQSYSFSGLTGHTSSVAGSTRIDVLDFCDTSSDTSLAAPGCLTVSLAATSEG